MLGFWNFLLIAFSLASVQASLFTFKGKTSKGSVERQTFDQIFSTVGFYLSPEDIFNKLTILNDLYSNNKKSKASVEQKRLVSDLIDLATINSCEKENLEKFDRYLNLQKNHVNVAAYIELHKERFIYKCDEKEVDEFIKAVNNTRLNIRSDLASLRSRLYYTNNGFNEQSPFYSRDSLAEAIVILMSWKNLEFGEKVQNKQPISFTEFSEEYERMVKPMCEGVQDNYTSLKQVYQKLIGRHAPIKKQFEEFSDYWEVNVDICRDVLDEAKDMPLHSYHEIETSKKGIFSRLFDLNPLSSG